MEIVLDADVVIRGEKGDFDLASWVNARAEDRFVIAAITVAELWHGVERASVAHRMRRQRYLEAVIDVLPVIPYTEATAYQHARLWASLEATGAMIGAYDLLVAAAALERDAAVATFNRRHFAHIQGLKIIQPGSDT
jgi:tRNA(fMet)-specific endonuclease VapC